MAWLNSTSSNFAWAGLPNVSSAAISPSTNHYVTTAANPVWAAAFPEQGLFAARCQWCDHRFFGLTNGWNLPSVCPLDAMPVLVVTGSGYQEAIKALIPEEELVLLSLARK